MASILSQMALLITELLPLDYLKMIKVNPVSMSRRSCTDVSCVFVLQEPMWTLNSRQAGLDGQRIIQVNLTVHGP